MLFYENYVVKSTNTTHIYLLVVVYFGECMRSVAIEWTYVQILTNFRNWWDIYIYLNWCSCRIWSHLPACSLTVISTPTTTPNANSSDDINPSTVLVMFNAAAFRARYACDSFCKRNRITKICFVNLKIIIHWNPSQIISLLYE